MVNTAMNTSISTWAGKLNKTRSAYLESHVHGGPGQCQMDSDGHRHLQANSGNQRPSVAVGHH